MGWKLQSKPFQLIDMENTLEYWKKRCELAEKFIAESPGDPDVTNKQFDAYWEWQEFIKNSSNLTIITSRLHEPDEAGDVSNESFKEQMDHINLSDTDTLEELSEDMNEFLLKFQEKAESMISWANEVSERYSKFIKGTKCQD